MTNNTALSDSSRDYSFVIKPFRINTPFQKAIADISDVDSYGTSFAKTFRLKYLTVVLILHEILKYYCSFK